jgi:hypothetical protein
LRTEPFERLRSLAPERADVARAVKQSGLGREGIRYASEEMTELRLLALNDG